jgi:GTP-binding protein
MSSKKVPIVAIVGRANVGKSSLFNSVLRRREAVVAMEPGTTRDSITAKASHKDHNFWLVDTAGLKTAEDEFELTIQEQIKQAADSADLILVVVEATPQITEEDRRVATMALKSRKPVGLIINKVDQAYRKNLDHFERLGIKPIIYTSATQNDGIHEMLEFISSCLPKATITEDDDRIRLAILGRPNVGKSALFNALAKKQLSHFPYLSLSPCFVFCISHNFAYVINRENV